MPVIESTDLSSFINALNVEIPCRKYTMQAKGTTLRDRNTNYYYAFKRYHLADVSDLLNKLTFNTSAFRSDEDHAIRYVIPADNPQQAYFSMEGKEKSGIAAHERLSSKCLAAGMLYFTKQNGNIYLVGMNHDSGYFQPTVESLIWPLKLFLSNPIFNLQPELKLMCRIGDNKVAYTLETGAIYQALVNVIPTIASFEEAQPCSGSYEAYVQSQEAIRQAARDRIEVAEEQQLPRKSPKKSPRNIEQLESNHPQSDPMEIVQVQEAPTARELWIGSEKFDESQSAFKPNLRHPFWQQSAETSLANRTASLSINTTAPSMW